MWCVLLLLTVGLVQVRAPQVYHECNKEGMIAFTYDQGPSPYTGILLTTLSQYKIKATFHIVPDYLDNPVLSANLRRAANDGHLIGLFIKETITEADIKTYLANASAAIKRYTNYQPQFLRFPVPGPSDSMLKAVTALGYRVTSYNLDSTDYNYISDPTESNGEGPVYRTIRNILDQIVPPTLGSFICVQRDIVQASVLQTPNILNYTRARGYKAVRLDTCIGEEGSTQSSGTGGDSGGDGGDPLHGLKQNVAITLEQWMPLGLIVLAIQLSILFFL